MGKLTVGVSRLISIHCHVHVHNIYNLGLGCIDKIKINSIKMLLFKIEAGSPHLHDITFKTFHVFFTESSS